MKQGRRRATAAIWAMGAIGFLAFHSSEASADRFRFRFDPPAGTSFYYLRVVQDNDEQAWSTPIWVTHREA